MATTSTPISPFPHDTRVAFQTFIYTPGYINRERIPYSKWQQIYVFIDNPTIKLQNQAESNLRHRALTEFELINRRLYRMPDKSHPESRYAVPESEAFNVITNEHLQLLHAGRDKVWATIQQKYYGINRNEVLFILKLCTNCALNRPAATKALLEPIVSSRAWERVQINLINMRHEPSG
jgi:hypothetical protein